MQVTRNETRAGSLNLMRPWLQGLTGQSLGNYRGIFGFGGDGLDRSFTRLYYLAATGNGAAGPDCRNKDVNFAIRVLPNFLGRGVTVDLGIGGIIELLRDPRVWRLLCQLLGFGDGPLHAF